jgi:hypothetical protein
MPRFLQSQFCDDIRHEIGNKLSMMGIYHSALVVEKFPLELPRLFVSMKASADEGEEFKQLRFVVLINDEPLVEMDISEDDLAKPAPPMPDINAASELRRQQSFQTFIQLPPLTLAQSGILRTRIITEQETICGDGLMILANTSS